MDVKSQLKNDLLVYPSMIKNKWSFLHQWLSVCRTNEVAWVNGELVDILNTEKEIITNPTRGIDNLMNKYENVITESVREMCGNIYEVRNEPEYVRDIVEETLDEISSYFKELKKHTKMAMVLEGRMNDLTQTEEFYPLQKDSILCTLPEEGVNEDWQNACREFYNWIKENLDSLDDETRKNFANIKTSWLLQQAS